jgi:GMP synthase (glutamine-hydrolysing)
MGKRPGTPKPILIVQHAPHEHAAALFRALESQGLATQVVRVFRGDPFPAPDAIQGMVSLGGPMGANDEALYPWIRDELELMKRSFDRRLPIAGICLGGQMLARALGGRVTQNDHPEIGWFKVELTEHGKNDFFMSSAGHILNFYQWHYDTFFLLKEAVLLGEGKICSRQAYRIGENAYGFQFHPEADHQLVEEWLSIEGTDEEILLARTAHHQECVHSPDQHREQAKLGEFASLSFVSAISQLFQSEDFDEFNVSFGEPCEEKRCAKEECRLEFLGSDGTLKTLFGRID